MLKVVPSGEKSTQRLNWAKAKGLHHSLEEVSHIPCFEAEVPGGKYRVAPILYLASKTALACCIGYEAFFIPIGAESAADIRDIAKFLPDIDAAKAAALDDYHQ